MIKIDKKMQKSVQYSEAFIKISVRVPISFKIPKLNVFSTISKSLCSALVRRLSNVNKITNYKTKSGEIEQGHFFKSEHWYVVQKKSDAH